MRWEEIRSLHPDRWLVVEALEAHSDGNRRVVDDLDVLDLCDDGGAAFARYREIHKQQPRREIYFVHTSNADLDIEERTWTGIRTSHAPHTS